MKKNISHKERILKETGLSEEEFYSKFPTEAHYQEYCNGGKMKMGKGGEIAKALQTDINLDTRNIQSAVPSARAIGNLSDLKDWTHYGSNEPSQYLHQPADEYYRKNPNVLLNEIQDPSTNYVQALNPHSEDPYDAHRRDYYIRQNHMIVPNFKAGGNLPKYGLGTPGGGLNNSNNYNSSQLNFGDPIGAGYGYGDYRPENTPPSPGTTIPGGGDPATMLIQQGAQIQNAVTTAGMNYGNKIMEDNIDKKWNKQYGTETPDFVQQGNDKLSESFQKNSQLGAIGMIPMAFDYFSIRKDMKEGMEDWKKGRAENFKASLSGQDQGNYMPTYAGGGKLISYMGPKHAEGGIPVNAQGIPVAQANHPQATAEVEGGETAELGEEGEAPFVYSDSIGRNKKGEIEINPRKVAKTFADISKKIAKRAKGRENDPITQRTVELFNTANRQANERALQAIDILKGDSGEMMPAKPAVQYRKMGGNLPKYTNGYAGDPLRQYYPNAYIPGPYNPDNEANNFAASFNESMGLPNGTDFTEYPPQTIPTRNYPEDLNTLPVVNNSVDNSYEPQYNQYDPTNIDKTSPIGGKPQPDLNGWNSALFAAAPILANAHLFGPTQYDKYRRNEQYGAAVADLNKLPTNVDISANLYQNASDARQIGKASEVQTSNESTAIKSDIASKRFMANNQAYAAKNAAENEMLSKKLSSLAQIKQGQGELDRNAHVALDAVNAANKSVPQNERAKTFMQTSQNLNQMRNERVLMNNWPMILKYYDWDPDTQTLTSKTGSMPLMQIAQSNGITVKPKKQ